MCVLLKFFKIPYKIKIAATISCQVKFITYVNSLLSTLITYHKL